MTQVFREFIMKKKGSQRDGMHVILIITIPKISLFSTLCLIQIHREDLIQLHKEEPS